MPRRFLRPAIYMVVMSLLLVACSDTSPAGTTSTPGTAAATTGPPITSIEASPDARLDEIRRITTDATMGRLAALYRLDTAAIPLFVGNPDLIAQDLSLIEDGGLPFQIEPTEATVPYKVLEVYEDDEACLVIRTRIDLTDALGFNNATQRIEVFWLSEAGAVFAEEYDTSATAADWDPICDDAPGV